MLYLSAPRGANNNLTGVWISQPVNDIGIQICEQGFVNIFLKVETKNGSKALFTMRSVQEDRIASICVS